MSSARTSRPVNRLLGSTLLHLWPMLQRRTQLRHLSARVPSACVTQNTADDIPSPISVRRDSQECPVWVVVCSRFQLSFATTAVPEPTNSCYIRQTKSAPVTYSSLRPRAPFSSRASASFLCSRKMCTAQSSLLNDNMSTARKTHQIDHGLCPI